MHWTKRLFQIACYLGAVYWVALGKYDEATFLILIGVAVSIHAKE